MIQLTFLVALWTTDSHNMVVPSKIKGPPQVPNTYCTHNPLHFDNFSLSKSCGSCSIGSYLLSLKAYFASCMTLNWCGDKQSINNRKFHFESFLFCGTIVSYFWGQFILPQRAHHVGESSNVVRSRSYLARQTTVTSEKCAQQQFGVRRLYYYL